MAIDALDPGPNGDYPHLDMTLQPTGLRTQTAPDGTKVRIDVEATGPDGRRVSELNPQQD
ncbi:hypothetical protein [Microbacterium oleivorans]|uniref:Uncharacterized protein n=1 Tax=Microbacterium oleivorans TaxID=273677 RepID=A0A7D5IWZ0_9MICO|nr:hypothetical protein [Microbacterium oleivorans]QLD11376.1 hypothetical protein HW566_06060 [Microbacterium oleivorans]